ncbi:PA2169 family four-helix-bundle protein [Litorimonas sp. RW-G-Af-16]|uniref:PA2169 family four-helix-bundle protein n=1 Tax=Litorimonas sp. RW-G-Af-16 TaxID=3241168 RepID=UPI00390C440E
MTNTVKALNEITETMIDSYKGYEKCLELSDDSYALRQNFRARAQERSQLINDFQNQVRQLGGEPVTDGSVTGKLHRGFTKFASVFQDDEKAAVSAIDDGEEYLAEKIEDCLEDNNLPSPAQSLLKRAHASAKAGERYADLIEDNM